jgi:molybdopterin-guanine dinucleotide biosynthesis protein A
MYAAGSSAGFILTGGRSSRMGTDKALLPFGDGLLVDHMAAQVISTAGSVCLVGQPERYVHLGYPAIADLFPGIGPLGGIATALSASQAEWNLIVACDMPAVPDGALDRILAVARKSGADSVIPCPGSRLQPVCAAYRHSALAGLNRAVQDGVRALHRALEYIQVQRLEFEHESWFQNLNTREEWSEFRETHARR